MLHRIKSLKPNRDMLKSHRSKNKKTSSAKNTGTTQVEFKTVSPEELDRIRTDIRTQARKTKQRELILLVSAVVIFILLFIWLLN